MDTTNTKPLSLLLIQQLNEITLKPSLLFYVIIGLLVLFGYIVKLLKSDHFHILPPGPIGIPFFGYLLFLGKESHKSMAHLGKKYGPVFSLQLGNQFAVVLNDYDSIKEAFVKQGTIFSGRPFNNIFTSKGQEQVLSAGDGPVWKLHRQFAFSALKRLGFGKTSIEPLIKEEINCFLQEVNKLQGNSSDVTNLLRRSIANNICVMIFGKRFEYEDPTFCKMNYLIDERIKRYNNVSSRLCFPWIRKIPLFAKWTGHSELVNLQEELLTTVRKLVKDFNDDNANMKYRDCYIESYLEEQKRVQNENSNQSVFDDDRLEGNIIVLMAAGSDTLGLTMAWAMKYLMLYPNVQQKIHDELDRVIGQSRTPCWEDRLQLPYTWAAMMEIMRITTILPLNIAHSNLQETTLNKYYIPKRSYIISNLWGVHHDPDLWGDPENFRPERFLSDDGTSNVTFPYFIPFSLGPRTCLGESMARMEYFLYFTMLLQQFSLKPTEGSVIDLDYSSGFTLRPSEFEVCFIHR